MANITQDTNIGGAQYAFIKSAKFEIRSTKAGEELGKDSVLRWTNGDDVKDLIIPSVTHAQFMNMTQLRFDLHKGGYVLSKRISRLMRPYFIWTSFDNDDISIRYLDQTPEELKAWDGAGKVSRAFVMRMGIARGVSDSKRKQLLKELRTCDRFEFTIQSERGQDKGHAVVVEDLDVDFVLPKDTKKEVTLHSGETFVGLQAVHSAKEMRLDIQSLINMHPFFKQEDLLKWLEDEAKLFHDSVESGDIANVMGIIDRDATEDEVTNWHLREYLASGGHPMWFGSIVKTIMNQHINRINKSTLAKMRLPVPGGRFYVMTDALRDSKIERGTIHLEGATAWVSADDWRESLAELWGGADQDDALWVFPFTDHDSSKQCVAWRSPNQMGEWAMLRPTGTIPTWLDGTSFPSADSRVLKRIADMTYLDIINPETAGGLGEGKEYSIGEMNSTIARTQANAGALGMYCNVLMYTVAIWGRMPMNPPAPLEAVIDAMVKTGTDMTPIKAWCMEANSKMLQNNIAVPKILAPRLGSAAAHIRTTDGHWLDILVTALEDHRTAFEKSRDELASKAMPPSHLFGIGIDMNGFDLGVKINQTYNAIIVSAIRKNGILEATFEQAAKATMALFEGVESEVCDGMLLGALASAYTNGSSDAALWQLGLKDEAGIRSKGTASMMIDLLRRLGVLNSILYSDEGTVVYPAAHTVESARETFEIRAVWYSYLQSQSERYLNMSMTEIVTNDKTDADKAKAFVKTMAAGMVRGMLLDVRQNDEGKLIAYTPKGNVFGYVKGNATVGKKLVAMATSRDGNMNVVCA